MSQSSRRFHVTRIAHRLFEGAAHKSQRTDSPPSLQQALFEELLVSANTPEGKRELIRSAMTLGIPLHVVESALDEIDHEATIGNA